MYEEVLLAEMRVRPEHPETLSTKHLLAHVLEEQGELSQAREMLEEVLEAEIRVQGPEHPDTLSARHCLAKLLKAEGELSRACDEV
jgi:hypothetical protein